MAPAELPATADVVVIGGGVMGTSIAFHLAEAGVRRVVLLERAELASGSTSKAAGGVRTQFSDTRNVVMSARSLEAFKAFGTRPGAEIDLRLTGYLFVLTTADEVGAFEAAIAVQRRLGIANEMVSATDAQRLCPLLEVNDVLAAAWSPGDGHVTPEAVVHGYASGARRHGAVLITQCAVQGIDVADGGVRGVLTNRGRVTTATVVCAAGAWSAGVAAMAGVDLPVTPLRRQVLLTDAVPGLPRSIPLTIEMHSGFYFHGEGPGLLMGMPDPGVGPGFVTTESDDFAPAIAGAVARRAPSLESVGIRGGWSGLHEMSPDHNALIGEATGVSRFLYATGFSGHGFQQGPAVGEIVRDLYLGREPFVDVGALRVERFAQGQAQPERHVV